MLVTSCGASENNTGTIPFHMSDRKRRSGGEEEDRCDKSNIAFCDGVCNDERSDIAGERERERNREEKEEQEEEVAAALCG
jgi:hypothetical protein